MPRPRKDGPAAAAEPVSYAAVIAALPEAVFIQDADRRLLDVNPAACDAYGYPREPLVGAPLELLAAPSRFNARAARAVSSGRSRACSSGFAGGAVAPMGPSSPRP